MTTPKHVDNLNEGEFKKLLKYLSLEPQYINGKKSISYAIHKGGKLYGYIGKKAFEYRIERL